MPARLVRIAGKSNLSVLMCLQDLAKEIAAAHTPLMNGFSVQGQFGAATPQEQEQLSKLKARMSSQLLPFRDPNGFRKLVVLLTEPGLPLGPLVFLVAKAELKLARHKPYQSCAARLSHACKSRSGSLGCDPNSQ